LYSNLIVVLLFSPDAKSFVIKQLLFTGLFNAEIFHNSSDNTLRNHFDFKDYSRNIQSTADLKGKVFYQLLGIMVSTCIAFPSIEKISQNSKTMIRLYLIDQ
jgi:hypothetical protein